jgi:predicted protein tyrosine phosphatase
MARPTLSWPTSVPRPFTGVAEILTQHGSGCRCFAIRVRCGRIRRPEGDFPFGSNVDIPWPGSPILHPQVNTRLRILFVCALNQWRSPTAEMIYRSHPRLEVRSAGVRSNARRCISAADVEWADVIFVMDREQKAWIQKRFRSVRVPNIQVLDIPGSLVYMNPELQRLLRLAVDPEIEALLADHGDSSE